MAEALIAARNLGSVSKGDLVEWRATGTPYGRAEGLPDFIRVKVPDVLLGPIEMQFPKALVVTRKITPVRWVKDKLRINMMNENVGLVHGKIVAATAIKDCDFDLTLVSEKDNELEYEVTALNLMRSPTFLGFDPEAIPRFSITQVSDIDSIFTFDLEYANSGINATYVERTISQLATYGVRLISNDGIAIRFQMSKWAIQTAICDKLIASDVALKCRYRIPGSMVDSIIAGGGEVTINHASLATQIIDKRDE